ncbi:MAG: multiheme c-type cytochrome [Minicystis sp.]
MSVRVVASSRAPLATALLFLAACGPSPSPSSPSSPTRGALAPALPMPGPAPEPGFTGEAAVLRPDAVAQNQACERCHPSIAAEWRTSLHRDAHSDPAYRRALAIEPLAFCRGCHAPEADPRAEPPAALGAMGVGCVTCHLVGDTVLAAPTSSPRGKAPHPVAREARFAGTGACAGCHEFAFPDRALRRQPELMQSTVTEHDRSSAAGTACAACHMPEAAGHRSHAFAGTRDEATMRAAVRVSAERSGPSTVRLTLDPVGVGHALPTGDLFRRLEIHAEAEGSDHQVIADARRYLTRHFRDERTPKGDLLRSVAFDDRPLGGAMRLELGLDAAATTFPIAWRVTYQRVEHPRSEREDDSLVESEVVLAQGVLAPLGSAVSASPTRSSLNLRPTVVPLASPSQP